jgi:hypothetical protein
MRAWHLVTALGVVLALAASAPAAPKVKKHQLHAFRGVVEAVEKKTGTLVVRVHHHRRPGAVPAAARVARAVPGAHPHHHRTVHVNGDTRFTKVVHTGRGVKQQLPAGLRDVHKGQHVLVVATTTKEHHARAVDILAGARTAKPKAAVRLPLPRKKIK